MSDREEEPRPNSRSSSRAKGGASPARYLYGALLVAIGGCLGIVIGSVSDTPRILFERLRGPVQTVDLEPPAPPSAAAPANPPLEAFSELQGGPAAKPKPLEAPKPEPAKATAKAEPRAEPAKAEPAKAEPPVSSAPAPAATPAPAKSPDEIVKELEKKAATGTVVQVLSLADKKQADAMLAKLKAQGFEGYTTPMPDKSGRLRVRVRPRTGETTAALEAHLRQLGFKTWTTAE